MLAAAATLNVLLWRSAAHRRALEER